MVSDLVPLKDRGLYNGIIGATFTIATGAGPFLGGAIVQNTTWRWFESSQNAIYKRLMTFSQALLYESV